MTHELRRAVGGNAYKILVHGLAEEGLEIPQVNYHHNMEPYIPATYLDNLAQRSRKDLVEKFILYRHGYLKGRSGHPNGMSMKKIEAMADHIIRKEY